MMHPTTVQPASDYVPADLDASRWDALSPLYAGLLERPLRCEGCLETLLLDRSELDATAREAEAHVYISMTRHTDDADAKQAYLAYVEHVKPELKKTGFALDQRVVGSEHVGGLDAERYGVLLRDMKTDVELFRDENVPLEVRESTLGQEFSEIAGAQTVEFDGAERTPPQMAVYLERTDRDVREAAWKALAERRLKDREALDGLMDRMIVLRHEMARNAGFENYRDYRFRSLHRYDYGPEDCATFHRAAELVCVPMERRLNAARAEALGVDPLRPWDLAVDVKGRSPLRPFDGADELVERSSRLFHRMDPELGGLFDRLRSGDSLDLESRKGKAPGGYQWNRDRSRQPFIFMNAAGLQRDVETLIHEAGHAFHSMLSEHDPLVRYRHAPIEFAEVASMGMELLALPYLDEFYDDPSDLARARRSQLESIAYSLSWIATIDAFQHWLYTNPGHGRDERSDAWVGLVERFGSAVSWEGLDENRRTLWQRQLHLYEVPFYYIEYAIAQLGALQIWLVARNDEPRALASYKRALALGGSRPLRELFDAAGLVFDFGPDTVARLMGAVQDELETLPA